MKRSPLYTLLFAAVLGVACAALLTAAKELTAARREANARVERIRHVLDVLGIEREADAPNEVLIALFEANVRIETCGDLAYYKYVGADGRVKAMAAHFQGRGLWGPIKGFLALEPDKKTIRQVTFYEQEETPGLGGEIVTPGFRKQFQGLPIVSPSGEPGITVHAISGATMTSRRVEQMLNRTIRKIAQQEAKDGR